MKTKRYTNFIQDLLNYSDLRTIMHTYTKEEIEDFIKEIGRELGSVVFTKLPISEKVWNELVDSITLNNLDQSLFQDIRVTVMLMQSLYHLLYKNEIKIN